MIIQNDKKFLPNIFDVPQVFIEKSTVDIKGMKGVL
jgi:hypothetical protein